MLRSNALSDFKLPHFYLSVPLDSSALIETLVRNNINSSKIQQRASFPSRQEKKTGSTARALD